MCDYCSGRCLGGVEAIGGEEKMRQRKIPAVFMRGGTSKAVMFHQRDLPLDRSKWAELFVAALGAGDASGRQLDGLGGGISSLSKVCVIGPPTRSDADVDYTFVQLSPVSDQVDFSSSCGNMTAAVGPFAVDENLVTALGTEATIRIHNTNAGQMIVSKFALDEGCASVDGDFAVPGVSGRGAPIRLEFCLPGGSATGGLLPTGQALDVMQIPGLGRIEVSLLDAGNPCVFVAADAMGLAGSEMPEVLDQQAELLEQLEAVRCHASVAMGITKNIDEAQAIVGIPKVALVSQAQHAVTLSGDELAEQECDITLRMISVGQPHRAIPVTGSICAAVAARVPDTVVHRYCRDVPALEDFRIAHPSGVALVGAKVTNEGGEWTAERAVLYRTARRLMDGHVYVSAEKTPGLAAG